MHFVSDLHLHSKYSRAVSPQMNLTVMAHYASQKGIDILTASDFTHPIWFKEIQGQLEEAGEGVYKLKGQSEKSKSAKEPVFLLSTEISSIYKQGDKLRRIHNLIFVPNLETAEKVSKELLRRGCNLSADGRPIIGLSSKALLELLLSIDDRSFLIPCHVWTPHFGIYGSASGFDSLEEAFGELAPYIYGIETGLSSDPDMNWQVKELQNRTILSFSDAHSPAKMGREVTVFDLEAPSYENIRQAIMRPSLMVDGRKLNVGVEGRGSKIERKAIDSLSSNKIAYTLEFYPEEGKYHFSGHRNCKVIFGPQEVIEKGTTCPVCRRRLTEGVFMRVGQLSDESLMGRALEKHNEHGVKWYTDKHRKQPPYIKLVPLLEIVAEGLGSTVMSQKSKDLYNKVCAALTSEMHVLLHAPIGEIEKIVGAKVAAAITKVREGNIVINPGFDGEYGKVQIWTEEEEREVSKKTAPQMSLEF